MMCYRKGGCGPYEMLSCWECPASKPDYLRRYDVVGVVRCKDCEYWMPDGESVMVCTGPLAYYHTDGAWYCASAKRRVKEHETAD